MSKFTAKIEIIGVNPYVEVPPQVLNQLFLESDKKNGPLPVKGTLNEKPFIQTVVKFQGLWRLYLNIPMRKATGTTVGDTVTVEIFYDPKPRIEPIPEQLLKAFQKNPLAKEVFNRFPPSHQKEYLRYLNSLKSEEALSRNIEKVTQHLSGKRVKGVLFQERNKASTAKKQI